MDGDIRPWHKADEENRTRPGPDSIPNPKPNPPLCAAPAVETASPLSGASRVVIRMSGLPRCRTTGIAEDPAVSTAPPI